MVQFESALHMFIFVITSVNFNFLISVLVLLFVKVSSAVYCDVGKENNHNMEKERVLVLLCSV
jgi:hypothetical protein